jgi:ABC-type branched-subunit amino acid transport system substrate-binding protein
MYCLVFLVAAWIAPTAQVGANDIVLGMSAAFTGPSKGLGIELYRGSMAYLHHVNHEGGVHGRRIVIKAYDDGYNPLPAIENTIRLIEEDRAFLLFNYVGTPTVTRCLPLLKRHRDASVLLFFPFTGAQPQRQAPYGEHVFNLRASYYQETAGLVDHFVAIGRKRIAVFYQADAYGRNGWQGVRSALARHGLKMVGEATYRRGTPFQDHMKEQVEIIRKTLPDAVISIGAYAACAAFIRDARDARLEVPIANVSFVGSESMLALLQQAGSERGTDYTVNLVNSQVVPTYHDRSLPAVREYLEYTQRYEPMPPRELLDADYRAQPPSFVALEGFLNARLLTAILRKMGPPFNREHLKTAAEAMGAIDLGIGVPVALGADRHQASNQVYFTAVCDGRFEPFGDWARWRK